MKLKLSKRLIVVLAITILAVFFIALKLGDSQRQSQGSNNSPGATKQQAGQTITDLSDDEIKKKFSCYRLTEEERDTDIYCWIPSLYRTGTISDEELKQKLGCNTSSPGPLCSGEKYLKYKAELQAKHDKLSTGSR